MKGIGWIVVSLAALTISGCAPSVDIDAERAALRAAADAYHEAASALDVEALVALNAEDVLVLPPGMSEAQGPEGAREVVSAFTEMPGFQVSFQTRNVAIASSGDLGYTLANLDMSYEGPDGQTVREKYRDFHVWEKGEDGSWKVVVDIWNAAAQ